MVEGDCYFGKIGKIECTRSARGLNLRFAAAALVLFARELIIDAAIDWNRLVLLTIYVDLCCCS